jgi:hypothetical protein
LRDEMRKEVIKEKIMIEKGSQIYTEIENGDAN